MAYWDIASLQADNDFAVRTTAAYATETVGTDHGDPSTWQAEHSWDMAAQPGFGDAYASAVAGGVDRPGQDPAVISDGTRRGSGTSSTRRSRGSSCGASPRARRRCGGGSSTNTRGRRTRRPGCSTEERGPR